MPQTGVTDVSSCRTNRAMSGTPRQHFAVPQPDGRVVGQLLTGIWPTQVLKLQ